MGVCVRDNWNYIGNFDGYLFYLCGVEDKAQEADETVIDESSGIR